MFRLIMMLVLLFWVYRVLLHLLFKIVSFVNNSNFTGSKINHASPKYRKNFNKTVMQSLVKCSYCGTYVTTAEAINYNSQIFCCKEHIK